MAIGSSAKSVILIYFDASLALVAPPHRRTPPGELGTHKIKPRELRQRAETVRTRVYVDHKQQRSEPRAGTPRRNPAPRNPAPRNPAPTRNPALHTQCTVGVQLFPHIPAADLGGRTTRIASARLQLVGIHCFGTFRGARTGFLWF